MTRHGSKIRFSVMTQIVAWLMFPLWACVIGYVRLTNIDMSETRLMVTYWPLWLVCAASLGCALYIIDKASRQRGTK